MSGNPQRVAQARLDPYDLPFERAWRSRRGRHERRAGWLIRLRDDAGREAVGESAPWPEAGTEDPARCEATLRRLVEGLVGAAVSDALASLPAPGPAPAARCGLEAALLGLAAAASGRPLRRLLAPDAADSVSVNAACGAVDSGLHGRVEAALAAGFRILKIKLGVLEWARELDALRALALPAGVGLRLDANGAWDEGTARRRLAALEGLPVECVEEPLADFEAVALAGLQSGVPFPLALDESLAGRAETLVGPDCPVGRVVLKPMVLGGAGIAVALARRATGHGTEVTVTTTLEAAPGRWLAAATAAATGSPLAHGLDTGGWLAADLGPGPTVADGRIELATG